MTAQNGEQNQAQHLQEPHAGKGGDTPPSPTQSSTDPTQAGARTRKRGDRGSQRPAASICALKTVPCSLSEAA